MAVAPGTAWGSDTGPETVEGTVIEAWSNGSVRSVMTARLTAYDPCRECTGKNEGDPAYGITRSGTKATANNTIAVDPSVIPLGSWVYIEGLGVFKAEDTGGAIKGGRIDVCMGSHKAALAFGVKEAKVHVLSM